MIIEVAHLINHFFALDENIFSEIAVSAKYIINHGENSVIKKPAEYAES